MSARPTTSDRNEEVVKATYKFAEGTYQYADTTMKDLTTALNMSRRTIERALAAKGYTWNGILTEIRCKMARKLLATTQKAVPVVAFEVGYLSATGFSRNYKRIYGETPMTTRKEARRGAR